MDRVKGKVAIVTGATGGIGAAIARALAAEGAKVLVTDIDEAKCRALAHEIGGGAFVQDVTDEARWAEVVGEAERRHGALHVLVNCAGTEGRVDAGTPENTELAEWRRVHAVNLDGTFLGCRTALPAMRRAGGGSIVNMASIVTCFATPNATAYGSSKAGVAHLTMSVAHQGALDGARVRCNSVHPGMIRTRMLMNIIELGAKRLGISRDEAEKRQKAHVPMAEFGEPDDVAQAVLFLASDESRYVTGTSLHVDGGWNIR
jgi:3(or 17)beta-hydroxysteroid dehydrogenase